MRRGSWVPTRIGIRRRNRNSIPRVRVPPQPEPIQAFLIAQCCWHAGEEIKEPEVDLSDFLARQRLDDAAGSGFPKPTDEPDPDEVDHSLAHLNSVQHGIQSAHRPAKGRVQTIEWDEELENMSREKATADANRGEWVG